MPSVQEPRLDWAVERCKKGDANAYRAIADAYGDRLFRIAYLITRDRQLSEDAMQEALVRGWQNINRLREGGKLAAWLNRILLNEVKKMTRRKKHPEAPIDAARGVRDPQITPAESAISSEVAAHLRAVLDQLNQEHRTAVVMRFYLDYTIPEIAEATGWAEGTVKSRLHRAMQAMRRSVSPELAERSAGEEAAS